MSTTKQFPRSRRVLVSVLVVGALGVLVAGGCTDDGVVTPTTTVPVGSVATDPRATTVPPDLLHDVDAVLVADTVWDPEKMDAVRDYVRAEQAFLRAASDPVSPDDADFLARFGGEARRARRDGLVNAQASNRAAGKPQVFVVRPEGVVDVDATTVSVTVCVTSQVPFVDLSTGATLDDAMFSDRTEATLTNNAAGWSVTIERQLGTWDGDSCR